MLTGCKIIQKSLDSHLSISLLCPNNNQKNKIMKTFKSYDVILQGEEATENNAISFALGYDFSECEQAEQTIKYSRFVDSINGIDIYYDYGADYYFFKDSE